jgi:hypothetical protein
MYQFSRSIYRELAPRIAGDEVVRARTRRHLLEASEATIRRLATDGRYFARPARTLFKEIRSHFAMSEQVRVYMVLERYLGLATEFLEALPPDITIDGHPRQCPASTRKGTPCRREPRAGHEYCPSHMHLEEPLRVEDLVAPPESKV